MHSFQQFLYEFGDRPQPWTLTVNLEDRVHAEFVPPLAPGDEPCHYSVVMGATQFTPPPPRRPGIPFWPTPSVPTEWEFGFSLVRPLTTRYPTTDAERRADGYHYETVVGDMRSSVAILSTVALIFQRFLLLKTPTRVIFTAKGDSRQRLYRRLVQRLSQINTGYTAREERPGFYVVTRKP